MANHHNFKNCAATRNQSHEWNLPIGPSDSVQSEAAALARTGPLVNSGTILNSDCQGCRPAEDRNAAALAATGG
eukprot:468914-Hanusia_phi.AAC.1